MRLTLRTMLAYLDDILEPADREEIGRKIEESEFARQLVDRIRESTHKSRLSAPKLSGKGPGMDPNTVAEYLDNTLAGERVPDFEKVCLESDTHLAEVAASHQILTLVLGQPVDVDPAMKRRIYSLVRSQEAARPVEPVGAPAGERFPGSDEGIIPSRGRIQVPEYLRAPQASAKWRTMIAAIALIVLLCGAITMALGPLDRTNPVARWLGIGQIPENQVAQNNPAETKPPAATNTQPDTSPTATESSAATTTATPTETGEKPAPTATASTGSQSTTPAATEDSKPTPLTQPTTPETATAESSKAGAPPTPAPSDSVASSLPSDAAVPPLPSDPGKASPLAPQTEPAAAAPAAGAAAPAAQPNDVLLGRLLPSKGIILLKLDPTSGEYNRLAASSPLSAGDKLLVLPTFRPTLTLSSGVTLQVPSETLIELIAPDAGGVPGVRLHFGRLIVMTTGQSGAKLRLDLGAAGGLILFTDSEATLAAEVRRYHPPGADPEAQTAKIAADLYAVSGRVQWTPTDGAAQTLTAPQRIVLAPYPSDAPNADAGKLIPAWVSSEQLTGLMKLAADDMELAKAISDDKRPLLLELREMADSRRIECRSLAVQCLALLDQFEPLITALNDADERSVWPVHIASVRSAVARGPETAVKVREAFQKQRSEDDGHELYRMLWGYTRDQLQGGDSVKLVGFLGNDNLDMRVLAFANLQEICHLTFNYRPDAPAASRDGPIKRWQDQQTKGLIVPKEPAPTAPASSAAGPAGRQ